MLKRIFKNNYFIAALLIIFVTLSATVGWTVVGDTDAYFSDSDTGAGKGNSGNIGIAITNIETDFSDSFDEAEPMYWGSIADFAFSVENQKTIAVDLETTVTVSSEESLNLELLLPAIGIYNKSDVSIVNEVPVLNDGAVPVGTKEVVDGNMVFTLPNRTLSGNEEQSERQIVWKNSDGSVISNAAYQKLSNSEKNKYVKCGDSDTYDLVFFFDGSVDTMANFSFKTEINGVKQGNSLGWKSSTDFTKYGTVGYNPYKGILEAGPDFNSHIKNIGYEYKSITFTDVAIPNDAVTTDVSYAKDGSVLAWSASTTSTSEDNGIMVSTIDGGPMYANWDCSYMFSNMATSLAFDDNFDSSLTENMSHMFDGYGKEGNLDLSAWTAENVTDMSYMFANTAYQGNPHWSGVTSVEFGDGFKENKVVDMSHMFDGYRALNSKIDVTKLGTSTVENMSYMFANTTYITNSAGNGLTSITLTGMDTSSATDMSYMFYNTHNISTLDVGSFDTSKVTNMSHMFDGVNISSTYSSKYGPTVLNVSNFDTKNVTDMSYMFNNCFRLSTIDVSAFDTSKVTNMSHMFSGCTGTTTLDVSKWITTEVTDMSYMFNGCSKVTTFAVSNFSTDKVTNMSHMFYGCGAITSIDVGKWVTAEVTDMSYMFQNCSKLTTIGENQFNTSKVTNMDYMFTNCSALTSLDASTWNTENVTGMAYMFSNCGSLKTLNVNNFDTTKLTTGTYMFNKCSSLTELVLNNWNTENMTDLSYMFSDCTKLTSLDISNWNTENVANMKYLFNNCSSLTKLEVNHFDVGNVTDTSYMFYNLPQLRELDLSSWVFLNNFKADYMFYGNCIEYNSDYRGFRTIYASDWSNLITSTGTVFGSSYALVGDNYAYGSMGSGKAAANPTTGYFSTKPELVTNMMVPGYEFNNILPSTTTKVIFTNVVDGTKESTDLSALGDGSVVGWLNGTTYYVATVDGTKIIAHPTSSDMFRSKSSLKTIDITNLDTSKAKNMEYMFMGCTALTSVNVDLLDVSNNISARCMFEQCSKLSGIDISEWNMKKTNTAYGMFYYCPALVNVGDISNWDMSSCFSFYNMFSKSGFAELDLSNWKVDNLKSTKYMFADMPNLLKLDLSGWVLPSIISDTSYMFSQCKKLLYIYAGDWTNGTKPATSSNMFTECTALFKANGISSTGWDMANTTYHFTNKTGESNVLMNGYAVNQYIPSTVTSIVFDTTLIAPDETIDLSDINDGSVVGWQDGTTFYVTTVDNGELYFNENSNYMFNARTKLISVDFGDVDISKVTNMTYMFSGCTNLETLNTSGWNTENVTNMAYMFQNCTKLNNLDEIVSAFNVQSLSNATYMFYNCDGLTILDLTSWDISSLSNVSYMFYDCSNLTTIYANDWTSVRTPSSTSSMFMTCNKLVGAAAYHSSYTSWSMANPTTGYFSTKPELVTNMLVDGPTLNSIIPSTATTVIFTDTVDSTITETDNLSALGDGSVVGWLDGTTYYIASVDGAKIIAHPTSSDMFNGRTILTTIDFMNLDTSNVVSMGYMFYNCKSLTSVNVELLDTSKVKNIAYMFYYCSALQELNVANWDVSKVENMAYTFYYCSRLTELDLSGWNVSSVTNTSYMFNNCSNLVTIYANDWTTMVSKAPTSSDMFYYCNKLIGAISYGGSSKVTWTYANPTTGYFTVKVDNE